MSLVIALRPRRRSGALQELDKHSALADDAGERIQLKRDFDLGARLRRSGR